MRIKALANAMKPWARKVIDSREPDFVVGKDDPKGPYMKRWYIIPRNKFFNIYLHEFHRNDADEALHDHPWWSLSLLIFGFLFEQKQGDQTKYYIGQGQVVFRRAKFLHRLDVMKGSISLFITGPVLRVWGFQCPKGWISFQQYKKQGGCGQW